MDHPLVRETRVNAQVKISVTQSRAKMNERVPRADKLNLLRDILHLLEEEDGISSSPTLFYQTRKRITKPEVDFSVGSTFDDYLMAGKKLTLMEIAKPIVKMTEKGRHLVKISQFGERTLNETERSFVRSLLLTYPSFRMFLSIAFCGGRTFDSETELFQYAECPKREVLMNAYMMAKGQNTDREPRTLLGWSLQIGLAEFDEYSSLYYLVRRRNIDLKTFSRELHNTYLEVRDLKTKMALIPEVRVNFCCSTHTEKNVFDNSLLKLYEAEPSKVQLGKGSSSRDDVLKFGIRDKKYYYYYIRMIGA